MNEKEIESFKYSIGEVSKYFESNLGLSTVLWNWNIIKKYIDVLLNNENSNQNIPQNLECPECGGEMISRKSQHGSFWGCKKYPKCKGTRDNQGRSKAEREEWKSKQEHEQEQGFSFNRK